MKDVALKILKGLGHFKGEEALNYVRKETQKTANRKQAEIHKLAKLPFAYTIYKLGVKKHIRSHFPDEGFRQNGYNVTEEKSNSICIPAFTQN